jgi:small subunit ribosomal protein S8
MSLNDPIADMFTRIRNANRIGEKSVEMPSSTIKVAIADAIKREGYIEDFKVEESQPSAILKIWLKYGPRREKVIQNIQRISKCGCRIYSGIDEVEPVMNGLGVSILSTNKGILSDREARKLGVGGEVICRIW